MGRGRTESVTVVSLVNLCCFAYVLLRPVSANDVLVPILGLLGLTSALTMALRGRAIPAGPLTLVVALQLAFGMYGAAVGFGYDTPGLGYGVLVYLVAPVLWWAWTAQHSEQFLRWTFTVIVAATIATSAALLLYAGANNDVTPELLPRSWLEGQGSAFSAAGQYSEIRYYGLSTLAAAGPVCAAVAYLPRHRLLPAPRLALMAALLAVGATLVTGRRSQVVVMTISMLAIPVVCRLLGFRRSGGRAVLPRALKFTYIATVSVAVAATTGIVSWSVVGGSFRSAVDLATGQSQQDDVVRLEQADRLLGAWQQRPFTGNGFGAVIEGFSRSEIRPWNFELQYHLILFQTGVIGVTILALVAWHARRAFRRSWRLRPDLAAPLIAAGTGGGSMLLVNAVNPYLQAPGHMWAVYLPFAVACVALRPAETSATSAKRPGVGARWSVPPRT